jgi:hypothetical protein
MSCELLSGYTKPNCANRAGLKYITIINTDGVVFSVTSGLATITSQTKTAFKFELDINSGFANQTPTGTRDNNAVTFEQVIMAMLKSSDIDTDLQVNTLSTGYFKVIATDRNGRNKIFGLENGLFLTTHEGVSGQAGGDMNGWTLNFAGQEDAIAPHLSNTDLATLIAFNS